MSLFLARSLTQAALLVAMADVNGGRCPIAARRRQAPLTPAIATWTISGRGSGHPDPGILGPLSWLFVNSTSYLRLSRLRTLVSVVVSVDLA